MKHIVKILKIKRITHDVKQFTLEKPAGYKFTPGQATDVSINNQKLKNEERPFTFTSLNEDPYLQFTIKGYKKHHGVTEKIHKLKPGDELIIKDPFGAIHYAGTGVFIAGGAGITPFIAILYKLKKDNKLKGNTLIFSNKTSKDIILEKEFKEMKKSGLKCIFTLTRETNPKYENRRIDTEFLKEKIKNLNQHFYVCGPITMVGELQHLLKQLGAKAESIVFEK